ncbi:hypothetical protein HMI54_011265 [Coelomomyces lativittatus]|nr:hypothetical protein HMI54_011265 [Coelomomyces lativittatus]
MLAVLIIHEYLCDSWPVILGFSNKLVPNVNQPFVIQLIEKQHDNILQAGNLKEPLGTAEPWLKNTDLEKEKSARAQPNQIQ